MKFLATLRRCCKMSDVVGGNNRKGIITPSSRRMSSKSVSEPKRRMFSGIQPTGTLHLGNYFGAVHQWINLQNTGNDCIFCIVDMHAITHLKDPSLLHTNILQMTALLLACGIDPQKSILYQQSKVQHHAELCWVLVCSVNMARLSQQPQFKEKTSNMKEIPLGLYLYPVLQAADMLLYRTTHVPAGEDQVAHINLTGEIVHKFNKTYGQTFIDPKMMLSDGSRVRSLRDPEKKMSKSDTDYRSYITLLDSDADIVKKCKKAVTDCTSKVTYEPENRPGVANLIFIHSSVTGKSPEEICKEAEGLETAQYKMVLADALVEWIRPIRTRALEYLSDPLYLKDVLNKGAAQAAEIAECTMQDVRQKVGFENDAMDFVKKSILSSAQK